MGKESLQPKLTWIDRVRLVSQFHIDKLRQDCSWRIKDTAKVLQRSVGSVTEDLLLASWLRTHEVQLSKFKRITDALEFVRGKRKNLRLGY